MKKGTWRFVTALLLIVSLAALSGWAQGVAPKGIIPTPPENPDLEVRVWVDKGAYAVGEPIVISYSVNQAAYIYIWDIQPDGTAVQLFPNSNPGGANNYVQAGEHTVPGNWTIAPPYGTEYIQILATTVPVDPFVFMTEDPAAFQAAIEVQILGVLPEAQRSWDFTSFEIVSGSVPSYGIISINSDPAFASISIDGTYVGYTPRTIFVEQGFHQIALSRPGYETWRASVFVIGGRTRTINAELEPLAPSNLAPVAVFDFSPSAPAINGWVQFDATASTDPDGSIASYAWTFGDGSTGTGDVVWHRFASAGTFTVALTITDDDGATDTTTRVIQVGPTNLPPVADFSFSPTNPEVNAWVQFNAAASSDPDGSIATYAWNFGDGTTGTGATVWHRYAAAGAYTVALTVTDDDGATDTRTYVIQVGPTNTAPVASFTFSPAAPAVGGWVQFDGTGSTDPDGTIASYAWNFGDGGTDAGGTVWHRYSAAGTFTVTLTVTDNDGATHTTSRVVQVGEINVAPSAAFTITPSAPADNEWVRFDGSASSDSDGSIVSYEWNYGDGTAVATGMIVYHQYASPGTYTVTLTVVDDDGISDTSVQALAVGQTQQPPVAAFTFAPIAPLVGQAVTLNGQSSADPDGSIVSYTWDLNGDGIDDATGPVVQVTYQNSGVVVVRLRVVDNDGLSATTTQPIVISGSGTTPAMPPMGTTAGIFVWGTDTWHVTVNAGAGWSQARAYRLELRTDGTFQDVNSGDSGVAPLGIIPTPSGPTDGGKTLIFEGNLQSGNVDYTFTVPDSESVWMKLEYDIDGDGDLDESTSFVHLRYAMVHPPTSPFVVGLPEGSTAELVPSLNFRIGSAITYTSVVRFVIWSTTIQALEGP